MALDGELFESLAIPNPLQAVYSWDASLAQQIEQLARQGNGRSTFDVVHVEHLRGVRYGLNLKSRLAGHHSRLPIVWDSVDSISLLFRQAMVRSTSRFSRELTRFELGRTERYEGWLIEQFDQVLVTSPLDKSSRWLPGPNGTERITVLPNGVDLDYFKPAAGVPENPLRW
jgi:glycosyltransferase involved in cell wall biosynthesis